MNALFDFETQFWLELTCYLRIQFEYYHPSSMDAGMELNIVDGRFFPPIIIEEHS